MAFCAKIRHGGLPHNNARQQYVHRSFKFALPFVDGTNAHKRKAVAAKADFAVSGDCRGGVVAVHTLVLRRHVASRAHLHRGRGFCVHLPFAYACLFSYYDL